MKTSRIEWNTVTWYSKLIAVIVFGLTFVVAFYLGMEEGYLKAQFELGAFQRNVIEFPTDMPEPASLPNTSAAASAAVVATADFKCTDGRDIKATFYNTSVKIALSDGRSMTLPHALSADGARYANADESFVFWNKGNGAFIEENGKTTYTDCTAPNNN